ncbi:hypothetical protein [Cellulomonas bogoriensis]|uniref:Uncharacterized protein n=1 Tax=Cellulomonas bogoriensis 69B4 = DSM 16987 TaxID=1386082 RepID=A0A0A0C3W6_9CELL|nr:hypothetical protein [Cellulomonas bogoriensis]KGM14074.1 hypothetical protein N869_05590 [Cellulomonas bogoriensis 69B4 = DSM 16987]
MNHHRPAPSTLRTAPQRRHRRLAVALTALAALTVSASPAAAGEPGPTTDGVFTTPTPTDQTELTWAPPQLENPEIIDVSANRRWMRLDDNRDYVLRMPPHQLRGARGISVVGGRNVVLIGGTILIPGGTPDDGISNRALYFKDQTGVLHVEGLHLTGTGMGEGIQLDQRKGAIVQLQNIRVETVRGSQDGHHADIIQTWAGPRVLRVDRLSGSTDYQGLFLLPNQFGTQAEPEVMDLRRMDIRGTWRSAYLMWRDRRSWPLEVQDVWLTPRALHISPSLYLWPKGTTGPGTEAWSDIELGTPPGGQFVPPGTAGLGYVSPGYAIN